MKTLDATNAVSVLELVHQTEDHIVLVENGCPVALVTRLDDDDNEWLEQELDPAFLASLVEAREQMRAGRYRTLDEVKSQLGIVTN